MFIDHNSISVNLYPPKRPYAGLYNTVENGLACHMLVSGCLLHSNLNVLAKPGTLRLSRNTVGIQTRLLKVNHDFIFLLFSELN
jgi:hypothetical protein